MKLSDYLKIAEEKAGSQVALAKMLGQFDSSIRAALAGKRGLPNAICIKLADYIKADRLSVIAASDLVTEKNEERVKILKSCIKEFNRAACIGIVIASTLILTPSPIEAAGARDTSHNRMYIMLNIVN